MWLSFARARLEASVAAEMELHCASCTECASRLDFSRKIAPIIELNAAEPPADWTDQAVAEFKFMDLSRGSSNMFGTLVFDSYVHSVEAVRSRGLETRHLVFELPGFEIDLSLEYSGRQIDMVVGQLLSKPTAPRAIDQDCTLELRLAGQAYSAKPNQFGEFLFSVQAPLTGEPLELRCTFKEGQCAVVLVPC
jgi:hypothetical protein